MFCSPWIASWENLTNVLMLVTTYEDLWSVGTCGEWSHRPWLHCQFNNRLLTQRQHSTPQQTMVHYTSGATESKLHNSVHVVQSYRGYMSLWLTNNCSIITVPMEETLLHKLQVTDSSSRYLQIPDCYKLSNGRFDVNIIFFNSILFPCTL